ncbi:Fic family protein [Flavobacterium gelidilacus]|uniref:Fic family protein n=1 Tax=Flavobacterium gelidilacus TaxID=206041 RepID=UPI00040D1ECF|nr:Fic family protein [Flavobacterium gelidilacus]
MKYRSLKNKIDSIKEKIVQNGKLTKEQLNKINNKFRLEWNFNSNSMEGNTLTIEETRSVMVGNLDVHQKPIKDVLEMKGHDEVISEILKIGKGELRLSEKRIKEIHFGIMHEEDPERKKKIGDWKKENNEIINHKGEKYTFVDWELVPERMHDLLNKTNAAIDAIILKSKNAPHPIDVALQFHLEYLEIHPFYDGNGRTARILTNLILIALGYTPFWITKEERSIYYNFISDIQSYGGDKEAFYLYMTGLVERSEQLVLDVIEGKDIEDEDDFEKELELLKRQLKAKDDKVLPKSNEIIKELYDNSYRKLFENLIEKTKKFDEMFVEKKFQNSAEGNRSFNKGINYFDEFFENLYEVNSNTVEDIYGEEPKPKKIDQLRLSISYSGFKHDGTNTFGQYTNVWVLFQQYYYIINDTNSYNDNGGYLLKKLYSEPLREDEIKQVVNKLSKKLFEDIKNTIKEQ